MKIKGKLFDSPKRTKALKESLRKAINLIGKNPVLLEPRYIAMVVAVFVEDDLVLTREFNKFLKESGTLNFYDEEELEKIFWDWMENNYSEQFDSKKGKEHLVSDGISLHRLSEALQEELKEKYERESEIKLQHATDKIRNEIAKEFSAKLEEIMKNTGQTSKSLHTMDVIIEKGGKKALDLLSDHIETAMGSTSRIENNVGDLETKVKKLEEDIQYDTIPGLYTVRVFSQKFLQMVSQFTEEKIPFSLVFLSVDKLDQYVSSTDPMISRKIILGVSQRIIEELQQYSASIVPVRYDANLMGILLPYAQLEEVLNFAEKTRDMIKDHKFTAKDGTPLNLTISAGVAEYSKHDSYWFDKIPGGGKQLSSTIFNRAIEALKSAQSKGGNHVEQEKETGLI